MRNAAVAIRTPEGIVFSQPLASPVIRFLAWLIDLVLILGGSATIGSLLGFLNIVSADFAEAAGVLSYFSLSIGYGVFLEWAWRGQTLGKRFLRLQVVDADGLRLQLDQIVTRNLLRAIDMLPLCYLVGGTACWLNRNCQRLGDIAANTIVIRMPVISEPDLDQLIPRRFNSLRQYPHLAVRLRQRVSPDEASTALRALMRRDEFQPAARLALFSELSRQFRRKVEFPAEAMDGIADEQYINNVVDIVYRSK